MQPYPQPVPVDFVIGDSIGLTMPAHAGALEAAGAAFLTMAFHAYGSLSADNRVTRILTSVPCAAGNSGHKLFLTVEYARAEPGLQGDLFVKFSRDFDDAFRDRRRMELEAEIRLAALSRLQTFPVTVARPYFADFERASGTGMLITERIAFGEQGIEPMRPKNMDHELADPCEYYRATLTALARLAAAHKSGALSPQVDALFPFDAAKAAAELPIACNAEQLRRKLEGIACFVRDHARLFPASVTAPGFLARFVEEAAAFGRHERAVKRFLHANPDYVALTHWNTHLDNAWFWRDAEGTLQCGLLDWGMVRQMNLAYGLWGGLSAASLGFWEEHLDPLLNLYADELRSRGGPALDPAELALHFDLSATMLCLALFIDTPALVLSRMPGIAEVEGPHDPRLREDPVVHGFLHGFTNFLYLWARRKFGAKLDAVLRRGS